MHVLDFPNEIQETILSYLDIATLIAATRTCQLWKAVANKKLLKQWCLANMSPDIRRELATSPERPAADENEDSCRIDWQELCERWSRTVAPQLLPVGDRLPALEGAPLQFEVPLSATPVSTSCSTMAVSGDCVIVADESRHLIWYDRCGLEVARRTNHGQPVLGIALVDMGWRDIATSAGRLTPEHDLVIVSSTEFLVIYAMPDGNGDCRQLYYSDKRPGSRLVSVDGRRFSHADQTETCVTVSSISTCQSQDVAEDVTGSRNRSTAEVRVKVVRRFRFDHKLHSWKLRHDSLVCLLQNGKVVTRDLVTTDSTQSATVSDFCYPFISFLYRGLIFCDISTTRNMLNYWHVNMGLPHWLVSADGGAHFKRVKTVFSFEDEVSTLCIHGTTMVAGTSGGRLCFYSHKGDDRNLPDMIFENPNLICKVSNGNITKCDFGIAGDHYLVCVTTLRNTLLLFTLPLEQNFETQATRFPQ